MSLVVSICVYWFIRFMLFRIMLLCLLCGGVLIWCRCLMLIVLLL